MYFKYLNNAFELFKENIEQLLKNNISYEKQSAVNSTYYSKKALDFNNINIDLNKTSFEIHNQIRAFIFKEYQLPEINGFKIEKSVLTNEFIGRNKFEAINQTIKLSGIDGYAIFLSIAR